ncbi:CMRF35-like molecule 2 [Suricata suricatta]|uniref:Ig-like domain-containing protein n=1 Tax=Suricata suricatta TaxID=37032 RepID=A0A673V5I8_SURSU|nr:CMRF35-like molecule 2 [Suricata suricatta]
MPQALSQTPGSQLGLGFAGDTSLRDGTMWLSPALLFLCYSGSLSLTGPTSVTGTLGGSLSVQCQYEKEYQGYKKYWCRGQSESTCDKIVETNVEEKEEKSGRVSIRDHADSLTFTVTMENLTADDTGSYWCRIQNIWLLDILSYDPSVQVNVSVFSAPSKTTGKTACGAASDAFPVLSTKQNSSAEEVLTDCSGSSFSSVHLLLLVFLKLPLFLTLVGAVLWVNRPLKGPGGSQPNQEKLSCSALSPGMPCSGIQSFRPDRRDLQTLDSRAGGQKCLDS